MAIDTRSLTSFLVHEARSERRRWPVGRVETMAWVVVASIGLASIAASVARADAPTPSSTTPAGTTSTSSASTSTSSGSAAGTIASTPTMNTQGDPYSLRVTALGQSRLDQVGLLTIGGGFRPNEWMSAEAAVWGGAGTMVDADVLTLVLRFRDPKGRGDAQIGRFVIAMGAIRPLHIDGIAGRVRLPLGFMVETFGGLPVEPHFRTYGQLDWVAGGRLSYAIGDYGSVGLSYYHRRNDGYLDDQELGVDFGAAALPWLDLASRVSLDLTDQPGLSEVNLSVAAHRGPWRAEVFGIQRSASHILPATSLFSVLGDVPSRLAGAHGRWRVAPRLDVQATAAARFYETARPYESLLLRSTLRLDDRGKGALALEARREGGPDHGGWTGLRATARVPIVYGLGAASEVEVVLPDKRDRGALWPWGLLALRYEYRQWQFSAGALASASPQYRFRFDALLRVETRWGGP